MKSLICSPLLNEIGNLYVPNAFIDDVNSIAIDPINSNIYTTNTASGTIDIISYKIGTSPNTADLQITRSIDIQLQSSPYFKLDYITSITYSSLGYIVASLIPLNYALSTGWLVFIDTNTQYIINFIELKYCYSPKHLSPTSDGNKILIACEGLSDGNNDPEGSISIIDINNIDSTLWKLYNIDFKDYDCYGDDTLNTIHSIKPLPNGIYFPQPDKVFSINVEPEFITIDNINTLQENNGIAILDIEHFEIIEIFSLGVHDFGFTGLDASDKDNAINIVKYNNVYGLRQADGIIYYKHQNGNEYILTANEGNPKYFDTLRVNQLELNSNAFLNGDILKDDTKLSRLKILSGGDKYGEEDDGTFSKLYTFGSRHFTIWEIEKDNNIGNDDDNDNCPCNYPYSLRLSFSSYDDFEQITAAFGDDNSFNNDFNNPSVDTRSDDKGPEPESIIIGECSNGDTYVFIGLERIGGIMVYDITDIDIHEVYFVEYLNNRDFNIDYSDNIRPPENVGDIEPETLIFISDNDNNNGIAYLFVGYKTSASIGVYSFNCGINRNYNKNNKPIIPYPTRDSNTVDECIDQSPCINIDIRPTIIDNINGPDLSYRRLLNNNDEMYEICIGFDNNNPYCLKEESFFTYGEIFENEQENNNNDDVFKEWFKYDKKCQVISCGEYVQFSILDGNGCKGSDDITVTIDGIDNVYCNGNENNLFDSCQWKIPAPKCINNNGLLYTTSPPINNNIISTTKNNYVVNNDNDNNKKQGVQTDNNNKESLNTFDTMTNKGGHFYESTMFFILLAISLMTCLGILICVVRSQQKANGQIEGGIQEEPLEFQE